MVAGWSYLLKKSVSDVAALGRAVEGAAAQLVVLDPQLVAAMHPRPDGQLGRLTTRQKEILGFLAQGFTNAAIAERLVLAEKSVENQINLLYQQLGIDRQDNSLHPRVKATLLYLQGSRFQVAGGG
jgi:DNA-binding NarL/FixJ family response regulator